MKLYCFEKSRQIILTLPLCLVLIVSYPAAFCFGKNVFQGCPLPVSAPDWQYEFFRLPPNPLSDSMAYSKLLSKGAGHA